MHPAPDLADREQPGDGGLLRFGIHLHTAHHIMRRRTDLHYVLGDVDVRELLELVVHARQLLLDVVGALLRGDIEEDAAVRAAAALLDLLHNRLRDDVAREQLGGPAILLAIALHPRIGFCFRVRVIAFEQVWHVAEHEPLTLVVF